MADAAAVNRRVGVRGSPRKQLVLIAAVQVLVLATWFSASAVVPALRTEWGISSGQATWLTASVQLGFVCGAVISATLNLPDLVPAYRLVGISAGLAAAATASVAVLADGLALAVPLRFLTRVALAGSSSTGGWWSALCLLAVGPVAGAVAMLRLAASPPTSEGRAGMT